MEKRSKVHSRERPAQVFEVSQFNWPQLRRLRWGFFHVCAPGYRHMNI